ncbi:MAG: phosphoribosyltransferase family protein [Candidatus Anstonellales archaeon]
MKSGRVSPYFFSTSAFYSASSTVKLAEFYADAIHSSISDDFDIVFGPSYKGIPLAVSVCSALYQKFGLDKKWCFDRKEAKTYGDATPSSNPNLSYWSGQQRQSSSELLVGALLYDWAKVLLVDDVFTTGKAKEEVIAKLNREARITLSGVFIAFDRQEKTNDGKNAIREFEQKYRTKVYSIITAEEAFEYLKESGKISNSEYQRFLDYKSTYGL